MEDVVRMNNRQAAITDIIPPMPELTNMQEEHNGKRKHDEMNNGELMVLYDYNIFIISNKSFAILKNNKTI